VDQAGNITKRHSATKLQFARFGSTCPLWIVHSAFGSSGQIRRQLAETPDDAWYFCLAVEAIKPGSKFNDRQQKYALSLGCEIKHADKLIYCDDLQTEVATSFDPIGISCRICERQDCHQRAMPPLKRALIVDPQKRNTIPYAFE
jgi:XRE family transcriptional regulator, fatty acid utilization regulator